MESQIFSLNRFNNYLKKYFSENRSSLRMQSVILAGVYAAIMSMSGGEINFFSLTAAMFIFGIVLASTFSTYFSTRVNKIGFLLTPVSQFEKFLAMVLHLYVAVPVMFAVVLLIAQYAAILVVALFTLSLPQFTLPYAGIGMESELLLPYFSSYFSAVAFYLLGATLFTRNTFLKTTGLSLLLGFVVSVLIGISGALHFISLAAMTNLQHLQNTEFQLYQNVGYVVSAVITLLFLYIAYMRMCEMETNETKK